MKLKATLRLENGMEFHGWSFGSAEAVSGEVVFNTSMVGYPEQLTDPTYCGQILCLTYPLIGNYGISDDDYEAKTPTMGGFIVHEYNDLPSNFRYTKTLSEVMEENHIPGIEGVDTRKLTREIRENGSMKVLITGVQTSKETALEIIKKAPKNHNAVSCVSSKKRWYSRTANPKYNVVAVDLGIKLSSIRALNERSCNVTVVPYNTSAEIIESMNPDGVYFSNGPGNPEDVPEVVELIKSLKGRLPILAVDLGYELVALAYGAKVSKHKFGYRGANHPVKCLETGKIEITTQSHSYTVDEKSLKKTSLDITHKNVIDGTVVGLKSEKDKLYAIQYHPEVAKTYNDTANMFDRFIEIMKEDSVNA